MHVCKWITATDDLVRKTEVQKIQKFLSSEATTEELIQENEAKMTGKHYNKIAIDLMSNLDEYQKQEQQILAKNFTETSHCVLSEGCEQFI